ncbi:MAG: acyltransferase domain-containing protein [Clostridiales bacterium]|nr:acyltransferase domain-containing protein [Clostridiales bacterium]
MTDHRITPVDPVNGDTAEEFASKIGLPEDCFRAADPLVRRIAECTQCQLALIAEDPGDTRPIARLADMLGEERDLTMLAVGILLGLNAHVLYRDRGIDDEIYYASMRELTVWSKTCMRERGHIGFYEWGWFANFLRAEIVRLGRLEFHEVPFKSGTVYEHAGHTVKGGERVINTHIPEDGPLDPALVLDAFRRAYRYFGRTGAAAIVCDSWLLWPGNYDFLPADSNIRAFMDCFDLIDRDDRKWAGDLWRVFGHRESYDPASLPRDTGLRRAMADYLAKSGGVTGTGYGVFFFDGERIL